MALRCRVEAFDSRELPHTEWDCYFSNAFDQLQNSRRVELNSAQSGIQQPTTFVVALAVSLLLSHVATAQPTEETVGNALQYPLVETATSAGWTASDAGGLFIQDADQSVPDRVAEVTATIPQPLRNSDSSYAAQLVS